MIQKVIEFINLKNGEEDQARVLENVKSNVSFRGSNLWILACAIVVACVGLNVNSTAVIIGAMLISPLMGPIVGAGFALGTFDFDLLKKSGKNLFVATIVSLLVATTYFYLSPFKETQSELLARTSPNIYDVMIAFFGGLVGVIAITRVEKGNPIPGVAIATALMPPLCTSGYGLAVGNYSYFFGAFYLYIINCFFICISTFFIVKYLKYQPLTLLKSSLDKKIRYGISALIIIMLVPSFYLAYTLFQEKKYNQKVEQFINTEFSNKGYTIIYKKTNFNSRPKKIELAFLTKRFSLNETDSLNQKLLAYDIRNTQLKIIQDARDIKSEILNEIHGQSNELTIKDAELQKVKDELSDYKFENSTILTEIGILFPEFTNVSIGKHILRSQQENKKIITVLIFQSSKKDVKSSTDRLRLWLEEKLATKDISIVRQI